MPGYDFGQLVNLGYWFDPQPPAPSVYFAIFPVLFVLGLLAVAYFYWVYAPVAFRGNSIKMAVTKGVSIVFGAILGLGLLFVLMRYLGVPYLSIRFLPALVVIVLVALGIGLAYFVYRILPSRLAQMQRQLIRQPYASTHRPAVGRKKKKKSKR